MPYFGHRLDTSLDMDSLVWKLTAGLALSVNYSDREDKSFRFSSVCTSCRWDDQVVHLLIIPKALHA